jgi:hypothetical protein
VATEFFNNIEPTTAAQPWRCEPLLMPKAVICGAYEVRLSWWKAEIRTRFLRELSVCFANAGTAVRNSSCSQCNAMRRRVATDTDQRNQCDDLKIGI